MNGDYWLGKMVLNVGAPKFYSRNISVYDLHGGSRKLLATGALRSGDSGGLLIDVKTNKLVLEIDNGDNPPLAIEKVGLFQVERSMLAYLEAGRTYRLLTGDTSATAPDYDLKFFTDSAKNRALRITYDAVEKNKLYVAGALKTEAANEHRLVIWEAIGAALLLLSLLTWKMAGEVKKRERGTF